MEDLETNDKMIEEITKEIDNNDIPPLIRKRTILNLPFDIRFNGLNHDDLTIDSLRYFTVGELKHCKLHKKHIVRFFNKYNEGLLEHSKRNEMYHTSEIYKLSLDVLFEYLHDFVKGKTYLEGETIEEIREETITIMKLRKKIDKYKKMIKTIIDKYEKMVKTLIGIISRKNGGQSLTKESFTPES